MNNSRTYAQRTWCMYTMSRFSLPKILAPRPCNLEQMGSAKSLEEAAETIVQDGAISVRAGRAEADFSAH
jgi:hypothetical protein